MKKICYVTTISVTIRAFFIPQLKYLAENGYDVSIICSPDEMLKEDLGESIHYLPVKISRGIEPKTIFGTVSELKKIFKREKFDMVQYSTPNAAFCASIAARLAKIKVRNYHLMGLRYLGMRGLMRIVFKELERFTCKLSTDIECVTASNIELAVSQHIFKREKAVVVGNGSTGGVDLKKFDAKNRELLRRAVRQELLIDDEKFVFGFVGRITRDKGVNELLKAFSELKKGYKLLIAGDVENIDTIDAELWQYAQNSDNIIILNSVPDIEKYYAAMDILVLPSYREGFGMVIAEAEAMATPVIVSNIPGCVDAMQDGITGLTVNVGDSEDLRRKMEYLSQNPEILILMSKAAEKLIAEKFDSEKLLKEILKRKQSLIG